MTKPALGGGVTLAHVEAATVLQREFRARKRRMTPTEGRGPKAIHAQAQKLMKSSNYEEAAKQLFHAFNLEHDAREAAEKRAEEAEKRLRDNPAK